MSTSTPAGNYFAALSAINVSAHIEKKGGFSYLSWPFAVSQLRLADPLAAWEVKRFAELKVGDNVTFTYYESVVYAIQKPGDKPPVPEQTGIKAGTGPTPGGTISRQLTTVVTVKAIDVKVPSITITTDTGNTMSFKVEVAKNLDGVKVGDKVQVTYTQALAIGVEPAKK